MSADDQDRWLEALAGRDVDGGSQEGRALREQIQAQPPLPAGIQPSERKKQTSSKEIYFHWKVRSAVPCCRKAGRPELYNLAIS